MSCKCICNILLLFGVFGNVRVDSANILAVFPFPGPSQLICAIDYLKTLAARGHEVTLISGFPQQQNISNFHDIPVMEIHENYAEIIKDATVHRSWWQELTNFDTFFVHITQTVLKHAAVQNLLRSNKQFDLIIIESLQIEALYALAPYYNAPIIGFSSYGTDLIIDQLVGNISPLSYSVSLTGSFTARMSFAQRLQNFAMASLHWLHYQLIHWPKQQQIYKQHFPAIWQQASLWSICKNFSLLLLNQHFSLSHARPYVPAMIQVGGLYIPREVAALPAAMSKFIADSQQDVIFFALGTNVQSRNLPAATLQMMLGVFAELPYSIMWKFENTTLENKPANVFISKWFPQSDILAQPKVKMFITHGGLLSTIEAIYHGKPMLALPQFYDQFMNVERIKQAGLGLALHCGSMQQSEFKQAILEIMQNQQYRLRIEEVSRIYRDQPMPPMETAIYWTEYVLRHKGAAHMQVPSQQMSFMQTHSLDVIGVFVFIFLVIIGSWAYIMAKLLKLFQANNGKPNSKKTD